MTTPFSQGRASRFGYGLGRVVRFFLYGQIPAWSWIKRVILISVVLFCSAPIFSWLMSGLMGLASVVLILVFLNKAEGGSLTANNSKGPSLWDKNGPKSLWNHDDQSRKW